MAARGPIAIRAFAGVGDLSEAQLREAPLHWPRPSLLDASLEVLDGVGPKLAEAAAEAGIATVGDLLRRVPHTHRNREVVPLAELEPGQKATVAVEVLGKKPSSFRRRGRWITSVKVGDDSDSLRAVWFNQPWVASKLSSGTGFLLTGSLGKRDFRVSEYEVLPSAGGVEDGSSPAACEDDETSSATGPAGRSLVPVHPATEKLKAQKIRQWVAQAIRWVGSSIEPLPAELRARRELAGAADAITAVHFPEGEEEVGAALERLAFEELFLYQAILVARGRAHRLAQPAPRLGEGGEMVARWIESLPFAPTGDQRSAFAEIDADLDSGEPMQRLLMGEVGSGKTVVAVYTMLRALEAGFQAALMAPTETLAEQHAETLDRLLAHEPIAFALLTGSTPAPRRREALERLATGELGLVVGTHALIEPSVRFARLGVCVVDEQHRFGVEQRRALDAKGSAGMGPHVLHMTATPIPRTLSLTAYGDLDTTALRELPAGRKPIETRMVGERERASAYEFVRAQLRDGRQAYVVCPLVTESTKLEARTVEAEAARLAAGELRDFRLGAMHGQMPADRKRQVMEAFAGGRLDVLVATTVIEVGIDVPNASVMLVEAAERYGVSQLHQLRGRVGRGEHTSHCLLFAGEAGELARQRLEAVVAESDGFRLAEVDLSLRGEGEVLGTRQHGLPRFSVAELPADTPTLIAARDEVLALQRTHGSLEAPALGPLMDAARRRFGAGATDPIPL